MHRQYTQNVNDAVTGCPVHIFSRYLHSARDPKGPSQVVTGYTHPLFFAGSYFAVSQIPGYGGQSFNVQEHQNCSTIRKALRVIPHEVQGFFDGGEGGGGSSSHQNVSAEKKERKLKRLWGRTINVFADFSPCTVGVWT